MVTKTRQQIVDEIVAFIDRQGLGKRGWYIGITDDTERRFEEHRVKGKTAWIRRRAASVATARRAEQDLLDQSPRFEGGPGGGDAGSQYVYAYKITRDTREG